MEYILNPLVILPVIVLCLALGSFFLHDQETKYKALPLPEYESSEEITDEQEVKVDYSSPTYTDRLQFYQIQQDKQEVKKEYEHLEEKEKQLQNTQKEFDLQQKEAEHDHEKSKFELQKKEATLKNVRERLSQIKDEANLKYKQEVLKTINKERKEEEIINDYYSHN